MQQLALSAPTIVWCFRQSTGGKLRTDRTHDLNHPEAQVVGELDTLSSSGGTVRDEPVIDLDSEHLFETECLRTDLEVCRQTMPDTGLELNGPNRASFDLDSVRPAGQPESLRPQRDRPENESAALSAVLTAVDSAVSPRAAHRVMIVAPHTIAMDQRSLARTVDVVLDR